jgi:hypothetical protein
MPLPQTQDPLIVGFDMTELVPQPDGFSVERQAIDTADVPAQLIATRVTRKYVCRSDLAYGLLFPFGSPHPAPFQDCVLKRAVFEQTEGGMTFVNAIYENPAASSAGYEIGVGQTVIELDIGLAQVPLELAPRFAAAIANGTITLNDLGTIHEFQRGIVPNAYGANVHWSDSGNVFKFQVPHPITGAAIELSVSGADNPAASTGTARELLLEKCLRGRESIEMTVLQLRETKGFNADNFATLITRANKLEYPGYGMPGTALNWKRGPTMASRRGNVREQRIAWDYSAYGWDRRYYPLA